MKHYQSDLYHDARWIAEHVNGETAFTFAVREWGTHIGTDAAMLTAAVSGLSEPHAIYAVELAHERYSWVAYAHRQDVSA